MKTFSIMLCLILFPIMSFGSILFQEGFDDANFTQRGWYDSTGGAISTSERHDGSGSFDCRFVPGGTHCRGGDPKRKIFTPSDAVYVSFWIKLSSNWVGSEKSYHPHMMYIVSNLDGNTPGFYDTATTAYIEVSGSYPRLGLQDGTLINQSAINVNLCSSNENRASHGCNGICDSHPWVVDCYDLGGGNYVNGRLVTSPDPMTRGTWHFIEAYFKMNSISGGKAQKDGIFQLWVDGLSKINYQDIIYRTYQHANMQFRQFALSPYIGDGSPNDQSLWIDSLTVKDSLSASSPKPFPPRNLKAQ